MPEDAARWQAVEEVIRGVCRDFGFGEVRTPVFEHTELFQRTAGETTDVVRKEMYTFEDRGGRSVTLRPEGTAPVVRAYLENNLHAGPQPAKLYYLAAPMFRYERPQAGRYRQHHQFGAEVLGSLDPAVDAELISLPVELLRRLGIEGLGVRLNSIGCPQCRPAYISALREYYRDRLDDACADCRTRYEANPLRMLDCKREACQNHRRGAPRSVDYLCAECAEHFAALRGYLEVLGLDHEVEPTLVRGFDYYTKTVFEIYYPELGAQDTVCGGGRYDGLVEELGGKATPGIGFGLGMERLLHVLADFGRVPEKAAGITAFVATAGSDVRSHAVRLVRDLRRAGVSADLDYGGRSLKSQLKFADRYPARYVVILGDDELARGTVPLRDLRTGEQQDVALDRLVDELAARAGAT